MGTAIAGALQGPLPEFASAFSEGRSLLSFAVEVLTAKKRRPAIAGRRIGFHVCVLRHGFSIHEVVPASWLIEGPSRELGLVYRVSRLSLQDADARNGWRLRP